MNKNEKTEIEMRSILWAECHGKNTQVEFARAHGLSAQFVNDVVNGRRDVTQKVANALGYEKFVIFRPIVLTIEEQAQ